MRYRRVGESGLVVSVVGLGCGLAFGRSAYPEAKQVVHAALEAGISLFDTADSYGDSEEHLGRLLSGNDDVVVASKFGWDLEGALGNDHGARAGRRYVRRAVERSLRRLNRETITLYQLHCPDSVTPFEETLEVLSELRAEGKIEYIGYSHVSGWQIADASWIARIRHLPPFVSLQSEYNLLSRTYEQELMTACQHFGIGLLAYSALARGLLTGKYRSGVAPPGGSRLEAEIGKIDPSHMDLIEKLRGFASERGISMTELAIGWLISRPTVSAVLTAASVPSQIRDSARGCEWAPSPDDDAALGALLAD